MKDYDAMLIRHCISGNNDSKEEDARLLAAFDAAIVAESKLDAAAKEIEARKRLTATMEAKEIDLRSRLDSAVMALRQIRDHANDLAGDPSSWSHTMAVRALNEIVVERQNGNP